MDGFAAGNTTVIVLAATNRPESLDAALLRPGRFDRQVLVDRPDLSGREAILNIHSQKVKLGPDIDLKAIATRTPGFSGADLANLVNEAALLAARNRRLAVAQEDFLEAFERVVAGLEKKSRVLNEKEKNYRCLSRSWARDSWCSDDWWRRSGENLDRPSWYGCFGLYFAVAD
jgi:ATP-dependent Zn proteases